MYTSLPREVELADDGLTVHVKPPRELSGLRAGAAKATPLAAFKCGQQTSLGADVVTGEFEVTLDVAGIQQVGTRSLCRRPFLPALTALCRRAQAGERVAQGRRAGGSAVLGRAQGAGGGRLRPERAAAQHPAG